MLPDLNESDKRREIAGGRDELETTFETEVSSFAYPFGIFGKDDEALAAEVGYQFAVTTDAGISADLRAEAMRLKRVKISGKEGSLGFSIRLRTGKRGLLD